MADDSVSVHLVQLASQKDWRWRMILCQCTEYSQLVKGLEMADDSVSVHLVKLASQRIGDGGSFCVSALSIGNQLKDWRWPIILCQCTQYSQLDKGFEMGDNSVSVHLVQLASQRIGDSGSFCVSALSIASQSKRLEMADHSVSVHLA